METNITQDRMEHNENNSNRSRKHKAEIKLLKQKEVGFLHNLQGYRATIHPKHWQLPWEDLSKYGNAKQHLAILKKVN